MLVKVIGTAVSICLLLYCRRAFRVGRIVIKGVTYTTDQPLAFALSVALIISLALMFLSFLYAYRLMLSAIQIGSFSLVGGAAMAARVAVLFTACFAVALILVRNLFRA